MLIPVTIFVSCKQGTKNESAGKLTAIDSSKASDYFQELNLRIEKNPADADAYYQRGKIFLQKNILNQAFVDFSKATVVDSTKPDYFLALADVSFRGLQIRKSIDAYNKCLSLDPRNLEGNMKLAELYLYIKGYQKSLFYANEALKIDERLTRPYFIKGFVYKETGDTGKAISSFQTIVDLEPENYDAYIQLGNLSAAKHEPVAIQYYNGALRIKPSSTEALYNRGLFLQEERMFDKAIADYNSILKLDSAYADAHYNLGYIDLVFKKSYATAIEHFSKAIACNKDYVEAFYNRGLSYEFSGNKEAAMKDYRAALSIFPNYELAKERLRNLGVN